MSDDVNASDTSDASDTQTDLLSDVVPGTEDQPKLFEPTPDWADQWQGMPSYEHKDLMPEQTLLVHFPTLKDRADFAKLVGQHLHSKTKFIWFPRAEIRKAADKVYASARTFRPRYPIYIISKGRWDSRLTAKALDFIRVPYHIVVEPQEYDKYAAVIDPTKVIVTPFSNLGQGGIPVRNFVWQHSIDAGALRHWILDDNISGFCRFQDNLKVELDNAATFCAAEDWVDRYENVAMAAFNYDYFAPRKQGAKIRPITLNTRCYSGILLSNTMTAHRWRGRYNEDTDLSLRILKDGLCTVLFNAFLMYKKPTLTMKGGNTDELYAGAEAMAEEWQAHAAACDACRECIDGYPTERRPKAAPCEAGRAILSKDGRWLMAESLREQHPDCTTVERKFKRWQHSVDYRAFRPELGLNVPKLKEGIVIPADDEYDLTLEAMPDGDSGHNGQGHVPPAERKAKASAPPAPPSVRSGVSALDFIRAVTAEPAPAVVQPVPAADQPAQEKSSQAEESLVTDSPGQPASLLGPAEDLRADLLARGHRLLWTDGVDGGKFLVTNASLLTADDRAAIKEHRARLIELAERLDPPPPPPPPPPPEVASESLFAPVQTLAQFLNGAPARPIADYVPDVPPEQLPDEIVLNFATDGLEWSKGARPVGLTVSSLDGKLTRFLPFRFAGGNLDEEAVKRWTREQLRGKKVVNSKTKFDVHMAREWGVDLEAQGCTFSDIQHTAALLDDHRKRFGIDVLAADYFPGEHFAPRVDESRHHEHHAADVAARELVTAQLVGRLAGVMYPELDKQELREVQKLEDDVIPAVVEMEKNGSPLDLELLEQYHAEATRRHDELLWEVTRECGFAFDHTAKGWQRLFEALGLPPTDGNAEAIINGIDHPLVRKAHLASQYASLDSKTFKAYKENVGSDGVLRFEINQLRGDDGGTVSGRFSIGYVQQVPNADNHSAVFGDDLFPRRLFIPNVREVEKGSAHSEWITQYLEADAAQIEYRLFAHFANNEAINDAYRKDPWLSFHKMTWNMMKAYKPDMLYSHQKSFNFAKQYGAKSIKLAVMMGFITEAEGEEIRKAKRWNDPRLDTIHEIEKAYKRMMPEGDLLLDRASHLAMPSCTDWCKKADPLHRQYPHRGYVKTLTGRRSRFPTHYKTYIGLNRVLQGTGADILKRKLAELHRERKQTGFLLRMTVHDAVGGDAQLPETQARVIEILNAQSFQLRIPILWECKTGRNWAECK